MSEHATQPRGQRQNPTGRHTQDLPTPALSSEPIYKPGPEQDLPASVVLPWALINSTPSFTETPDVSMQTWLGSFLPFMPGTGQPPQRKIDLTSKERLTLDANFTTAASTDGTPRSYMSPWTDQATPSSCGTPRQFPSAYEPPCLDASSPHCQTSVHLEEALVHHFEQEIVPNLPVSVKFPSRYHKNTCFRAAVLALSASTYDFTPDALGGRTAGIYRQEEIFWKYYENAVKDLHEQLQRPGEKSYEQLAGAALLLAYHGMASGSPLGIRNHAAGLNAIVNKLDFRMASVAGLFKAWRMIRYETRFLALATRKSHITVDAYDAGACLDPQLEIRDIYSRAWGIYSRYSMEATFLQQTDNDGRSASQKAAQWTCSVLNRRSDLQQIQTRDYYQDELTMEAI